MVHVAGYTKGAAVESFLTIAYSSSGVEQWTAISNTSPECRYIAHAIDVAADGRVVVTGYAWDDGNEDMVTIMYDAGGVEQWRAGYDGPAGLNDRAYGVAIDGGNVYVAGYSENASNLDAVTIRYSAAGAEQWVQRYNGDSDGDDTAVAVALNAGVVCVTGRTASSTSNVEWVQLTLLYAANGAVMGADAYPGGVESPFLAYAVVARPGGGFVVAGPTDTAAGATDILAIRYSVPDTSQLFSDGFETGDTSRWSSVVD